MNLLGAVLAVSLIAIRIPGVPEPKAPPAPAAVRPPEPARRLRGVVAAELSARFDANILVNPALERCPVLVPDARAAAPALTAVAAAANADLARLAHVRGRPTWALVPRLHPVTFVAPPAHPDARTELRAADTPLLDVFATLAILARVNVVVQPRFARKLATIRLRGMTALEMVFACAQVHGLVVQRVAGVEGRPTYVLHEPDSLARGRMWEVPAQVSRAGRMKFAFRDVELSNISQVFAKMAGVNLVVDPQVARAKMTLELRDVTPVEALRVMCLTEELAGVVFPEVRHLPTLAIGRPDKLRKRPRWDPPHPKTAPRDVLVFKDVTLRDIFQVLAVRGGFNVVADPQVARARMCFELQGASPLEALAVVAGIQELAVIPVRFVGGRPTYAVGRRDRIERGFWTPALKPGKRSGMEGDAELSTLLEGLAREGGFTIDNKVPGASRARTHLKLADVTPAEALALVCLVQDLQLRATPAGYAIDLAGADLRETVLDLARRGPANVILESTQRDLPARERPRDVRDAGAQLRQVARRAGLHLMARGRGDGRIRVLLSAAPERAATPFVARRDGPPSDWSASGLGLQAIAEEMSRAHGANAITADPGSWTSYSLQLRHVTPAAVLDAVAAAAHRPVRVFELPDLRGRPAFLLAPPEFVVPPFPVRPPSEPSRRIAFCGLPWPVAVHHLARLGGFAVTGPLSEPHGTSWRDLKDATLDLQDITPLEALYVLALRNKLKVEAVPDTELGSTYRLVP